MNLHDMDYVRSALLNAHASGMDLTDVLHASLEAETAQSFDCAVNILSLATPDKQTDKEGV